MRRGGQKLVLNGRRPREAEIALRRGRSRLITGVSTVKEAPKRRRHGKLDFGRGPAAICLTLATRLSFASHSSRQADKFFWRPCCVSTESGHGSAESKARCAAGHGGVDWTQRFHFSVKAKSSSNRSPAGYPRIHILLLEGQPEAILARARFRR